MDDWEMIDKYTIKKSERITRYVGFIEESVRLKSLLEKKKKKYEYIWYLRNKFFDDDL
jgi:hypothetical protein